MTSWTTFAISLDTSTVKSLSLHQSRDQNIRFCLQALLLQSFPAICSSSKCMTHICFAKVWRIIQIGRSLWKTQSSCLIKAGLTSLSEFVVQGFTLRSSESQQVFSWVQSLSLLGIFFLCLMGSFAVATSSLSFNWILLGGDDAVFLATAHRVSFSGNILGEPALAGPLDKMICRGCFQPEPFCDFVIFIPKPWNPSYSPSSCAHVMPHLLPCCLFLIFFSLLGFLPENGVLSFSGLVSNTLDSLLPSIFWES